MKLTKPQRKALERAVQDPLGLVAYYDSNGRAKHARVCMMKALCERGLFTKYVHGGYEITAAGRAALSDTKGLEKDHDRC